MAAAQKFDLNAFLQREDLKAELLIKTPEDQAEKAQRLKIEFQTFLIKDLGPYVLAFVIVLIVLTYCAKVLFIWTATGPDRDRAWTAVISLLTAVSGMIFGKASAK